MKTAWVDKTPGSAFIIQMGDKRWILLPETPSGISFPCLSFGLGLHQTYTSGQVASPLTQGLDVVYYHAVWLSPPQTLDIIRRLFTASGTFHFSTACIAWSIQLSNSSFPTGVGMRPEKNCSFLYPWWVEMVLLFFKLLSSLLMPEIFLWVACYQ